MFGAVTNGSPVSSARRSATRAAQLGVRVEAGADRRAAERQLAQVGQRRLERAPCRGRAAPPSRDLLAERERCRVHEVRAADLDDRRGTRPPSPRASRAAASTAGITRRVKRDRAATWIAVGNDVVRRLAAVHVVVRVDEAALAARAAEDLARAVGERPRSRSCSSACRCRSATRRAGTRRPAGRRAPRRTRATIARPSRRRARRARTLTCATAFFTSASAWTRAIGMRSPEIRKFAARALGLRAPQPVGRHLDFPERVLLDARRRAAGVLVHRRSCRRPGPTSGGMAPEQHSRSPGRRARPLLA